MEITFQIEKDEKGYLHSSMERLNLGRRRWQRRDSTVEYGKMIKRAGESFEGFLWGNYRRKEES